MNQLSGYHYMWIMVMFDLPVIEKEDRKAATDFRKALLDNGFMMSQYSVYNEILWKKRKIAQVCKSHSFCFASEGKSKHTRFHRQRVRPHNNLCQSQKIRRKNHQSTYNI